MAQSNNSKFSNNFVRGGQLNIHNLRMIKQVLTFSFVISFAVMATSLTALTIQALPTYIIKQYIASYKAEGLMLVKHRSTQHTYTISWPKETHNRRVRGIDIINHPYTHQMRAHVNAVVVEQFQNSLYIGLGCLLLLMIFWGAKGNKSHKHKTLRGQTIVSPKQLKRLIQKAKKASNYKIEDLPLIKDSETKHILSVGTTGAGKTNWFNELLPQIRDHKAIVVDTTGDMISKYYNEDRGDIILNPYDVRSSSWDILSECIYDYEFLNLSKAIIPSKGAFQDPLWRNGAAKLLSVALQKAKDQGLTPRELFSLLTEESFNDYCEFFAGTEASTFARSKGEKTALSFQTELTENIHFLKVMKNNPDKKVSLKQWVQDDQEKSWLFVTANENMLPTLNPYIAAMFNMIATSLMSLSEDPARRVWFVMDELPVLQKLDALQALLSKGRKYGACVLGGIQSMSQFEELYGHQGAKTILNLFNSKFFFRMEESSACDQISRWIGEEEIEESKEGLSYGAHQMRDGVSLNTQKSNRRLVMPTQISQLQDLECYVKLPGSFPVTKLTMTHNKINTTTQAFQL